MDYRTYSVSRGAREPLLEFMLDALRSEGCRILRASPPDVAPFRFSFETPAGERMGVVAYAFLANSRPTKNRPADEHRFQLKYGSKDGRYHDLWQDPYLLYTSLLVGIDPELGIFVGADPVLHSPTRLFISLEFKRAQVDLILSDGWHAWERETRPKPARPRDPAGIEILVGGTKASFLRYVRFERDAAGEDPGHRQLLAEKALERGTLILPAPAAVPAPPGLHALSEELQLSETEVLDLIAQARRLKMAVRGWVAEEHLVRTLRKVEGVTHCERNDAEGQPDVQLNFAGQHLTVECKNVLRHTTADGRARIDFQRTRASKNDPCSRYYAPREFDILAACLHAVTERWEFQYVLPRRLDGHKSCAGKLSNLVRVDSRWASRPEEILRAAVG